MATSSDLCSDMMSEILTHVSLETLDTCKAVRKEWRKLIHESTFMPTYCKRTKTLSGYYIQDMVANEHLSKFVSINHSDQQGSKPSVESFPEDMQILASSNQGILCCARRTGRYLRYYVCKPSTKQWKALPNPKTRYPTVSVGLVVIRSSPLHFKIVRISVPRTWPSTMHQHYRSEIFDSTTWAWKEAKHVILPQGVVFKTTTVAVNASGSIYWLTSDDNVLAFHVDHEGFSTFPLPEPMCNNECYKYKQLMEYQGKLGFSCMVQEPAEQYLELWVVENCRTHLWKNEKVVDMTSFGEKEPSITPAGFYNADIAFMKDYHKVIFYKSQDRSFDVIKIDDLIVAREIFQFRSDFESINLSNR